MMYYQDIPRIYTAIAEWSACIAILYSLQKEKFQDKRFWIITTGFLVCQIVFLEITSNVPKSLWLPCMMGAVAMMFAYLMFAGEMNRIGAGYSCAKAFLIAEFIASLAWQIFTYSQSKGYDCIWLKILVIGAIYGIVLLIINRIEKTFQNQNYMKHLTGKEVFASVGTAFVVFGFSNLSFVYNDLLFTTTIRADIFFIRTLVDFAGIAIIYVYQSRICEFISNKELSAMNAVLKSQYDQYRTYQNSLDLIHMKYHDLKHQITGLRMETDEERRKKWIDAMEEEISTFEAFYKTGNQVVDTILAAKIFYSRKHNIKFTCVADGRLLNFMHVTDICSIFGNALGNAIEHLILVADVEKRLVHINVTSKKNFVYIKIENYCDVEKLRLVGKTIVTTKSDKENHGFGLKSIRAAAEKYGGTIDFGQENHWFVLKILIPRR